MDLSAYLSPLMVNTSSHSCVYQHTSVLCCQKTVAEDQIEGLAWIGQGQGLRFGYTLGVVKQYAVARVLVMENHRTDEC